MNRIFLTFLIAVIFLCSLQCCTDNRVNFTVINFNLNDSIELRDFNKWTDRNVLSISNSECKPLESLILWDTVSRTKCFYEDNQYHVFGTNMGEFGGSIVFRDKSSDFSYLMDCNDILMVNFQNNAYYVTDALADAGYGHTRILKIVDPRELIKISNVDLPGNLKSLDSIIRTNSILLKELEAKIVLLDTSNVTASVFYPYKDSDYLIYSAKHENYVQFDEVDTTFLGQIVDHTLITLDTILPLPTWTMDFKPNQVHNGVYKYDYTRKAWRGDNILFIDSRGSIYIKGDTIVIGYMDNDRRERNR